MKNKIFAFMLALIGVAATAQVPEVTSFYPNSSQSTQEYKQKSSIYIYFTSGSQIVSATGELVQNGNKLGDVVFKGNTVRPTYTATLKYADNEATMSLIQPGEFTINVYTVEYLADGETQTYTSDTPLGSTTYRFLGSEGTLVSEQLFASNTMLSYYPAEGSEGVISFTFSKPIDGSNIHAYFEYGGGDAPYITNLTHQLSDDARTISIDIRGKAYPSSDLAYGNTFYDENGNPTDPPSVIVLVMDNLACQDGTLVATESKSLDGQYSYTLHGRMYKTMNYKDISFQTPVLTGAEFYASSNPGDTHATPTADCDMMALSVSDAAVLAKTDITFTTSEAEATIAWKDIKLAGELMRVALPAEIGATNDMTISLTNYSFKEDDGLEHIIAPLYLGNATHEVASVAEVKALDEGTEIILNVPAGVKVTYASADTGLCFIEDENDGLSITTESGDVVLETSTLVKGKLYGTYQGGGLFCINADKSSFTSTGINTATGIMVDKIDEVATGIYDYRLVSFVNTVATPISVGETPVIADQLECIDPAEELAFPASIDDITGVLYYEPSLDLRYLLVRSASDINQELPNPYQPNGIATATANSRVRIYRLNGTRAKQGEVKAVKAGKNHKAISVK